MPQAGTNTQGRLWRFHNPAGSDDDVGGSIPSGTILKENVFGRMEQLKSTQVLLEQGLEIPEMFQAYLFYTGEPIDLQHNDVLQIYSPPISPHYNKGFRIIGYRHSSHQDARRFVEVTMRRWETSRNEAFQFQGMSVPVTPTPVTYVPSLDFSDLRNSSYIPIL